jgi:hypothetical protein
MDKVFTALESAGLCRDVIDLIAEKIHNMYIKEITTYIHLSEFEISLIESEGDFTNTKYIVSDHMHFLGVFIEIPNTNEFMLYTNTMNNEIILLLFGGKRGGEAAVGAAYFIKRCYYSDPNKITNEHIHHTVNFIQNKVKLPIQIENITNIKCYRQWKHSEICKIIDSLECKFDPMPELINDHDEDIDF